MATVRARVSEELHDDAAIILKSIGLSFTDLIRMTLTRLVADKALPTGITQPNAVTLAALEEANQIRQARKARFAAGQDLFDELEKKAR